MHVHLGHIPRGNMVRTDAAVLLTSRRHADTAGRRPAKPMCGQRTLTNWCPDQGHDQVMRTDPFRYDEKDIGWVAGAVVRV
jgi:hypothetical protein